MELEESTLLTSDYTTKIQSSDYTTKLQSSRQHGTGRKTDRWKKIENPEINPHTYGYLRLYNGAKTASSISGGGKI